MPRPTRAEAEPAVLELLRRHGGRLMSVARRYSSTREDAEDAYQRAVEILLRRAPSTDTADLLPWMKTVVKHEAFAVGRQRARHGTPSEADQIEPLAGVAASPAELVERRDRLRLGAEALRRLKPQEVRALLLRAEGLSYREICAATGWSYTKVNRCLSEGRQSFVDRVAGIESGDECERLAPLVSSLADGEATEDEVAALRPHLSGCLACRALLREYRRAPAQAAAVAVPAGLVASLWARVHGLVAYIHGAAQAGATEKAVTVAASAAVLAGGGAATITAVGGHARHRTPVHRRAAPRGIERLERHAPVQLRIRRVPAGNGAAPHRPLTATHSSKPAAPKASRPQPMPADTGEFAPGPAPARSHATPPHSAASPAAPSGGEFAP